jgi:hypothetical protein
MILVPIQSHVNTLHYAALACYSVIRALVRETGPVYERPVPFPYSQEVCDIKRLAAERRGLSRTCARPTRASRLPTLFLGGSGQGCPLLRASNEHILIVRVLRARRAPGRSLPILPRARVPRAGGRPGHLPLPLQSAAEGAGARGRAFPLS